MLATSLVVEWTFQKILCTVVVPSSQKILELQIFSFLWVSLDNGCQGKKLEDTSFETLIQKIKH